MFANSAFWDYLFAPQYSPPVPHEAETEDPSSERVLDQSTEEKRADIAALIEERLERIRIDEDVWTYFGQPKLGTIPTPSLIVTRRFVLTSGTVCQSPFGQRIFTPELLA